MIPHAETTFVVRLETNEMIERERFAALLGAIEVEVRRQAFAGSDAVLLIGAISRGSLDLTLAIAGVVVPTVLAIPPFLVSLKQLARDRKPDPNPFAVALAEVMALDGTSRAEFSYKDTLVTICRDDVTFLRRITSGGLNDAEQRSLPTTSDEEFLEDDEKSSATEDEDQDWVPALEARDAPPRESGSGPSGYISSLSLFGEFEIIERRNGSREIRFVPQDTTLAPYFVVTSNAYETEPEEMTKYQVGGDVAVEGNGPGKIDILSIAPSDDPLLTLRE